MAKKKDIFGKKDYTWLWIILLSITMIYYSYMQAEKRNAEEVLQSSTEVTTSVNKKQYNDLGMFCFQGHFSTQKGIFHYADKPTI